MDNTATVELGLDLPMAGTAEESAGITLDEQVAKSGNAPCEHCGKPFWPRTKSGGKPQKFCSAECRREADAERKANAPQCEQREAQREDEGVPVVEKKTSRMTDEQIGACLAIAVEHGIKAGEQRAMATAANPPPAEDFDWSKEDSVVVPEQQAVAVYWNPKGNLVIRQEKVWSEEEDPFIVIERRNICVFIDRLCDLAGIGNAGR